MKILVRNLLQALMRVTPLRAGLRMLSHAGLLPAQVHKRLPVKGTFDVKISAAEGFKYVSSAGDQTGRVLYWEGKGGIDPETLEYFEPLIRNAKSFADVGANVGHFTLYACAVNPQLQVHCFEPVARTCAHLQQNIDENNWGTRCRVNNMAAGRMDGSVDLHVPYDDFPFSASLNREGFNNIAGELVKTPITRLDTYFKEHTPPDVLKIDVEGFEHDVLAGCAGLFDSGARPVIILECNPGGPAQEITEILKPLGYEFLLLRDQGPVACSAIEVNEREHFRNWAAVPSQEQLKAA